MSNPFPSSHPFGCCCWDAWPNAPTLQLSFQYGSGALFGFGGTGYAGNNLFEQASSADTFGVRFAADYSGTATNGCPPDNICTYGFEQINEFDGEAKGYEENEDPCWDWKEIEINTDFSNIVCPSSYDPEESTCENLDSRSIFFPIQCSIRNSIDGSGNYFCPPFFGIYYDYTASGKNLCKSCFDSQSIPNITRKFKSAYFDTIVPTDYNNQDADNWTDYFASGAGFSLTPVIASLTRARRDHRKSMQKFKMRFAFVPPPSCYAKIWIRAVIETNKTNEAGDCFPYTKKSQEIVDWEPIEWIGNSVDCKPTSGYPYSGNEIILDYVHEELGKEIGFFEEGEEGVLKDPEELYGVTCGHSKTIRLYFKHSYIKDYEPDWGCYTFEDENGTTCLIYNIFDESINEGPCLNHNGLPNPICHDI